MAYFPGVPSNILNDSSISINGVNVVHKQIIGLEISWDIYGLKVHGRITFTDITSLIEQSGTRGGDDIVINLTDFDNKKYKETFTIIEIKHTMDKAGEIITIINFIDKVTENAVKSYPEKSWASADMVTVIKDNLTLSKYLNKKTQSFTKGSEKFENFVIPLNMSFNVVISWLIENSNSLFYQTRDKYVIDSVPSIFSKPSTGDKFIYKTNNQSYRSNIYEYKTKFGGMLMADALMATSKIASFDIFNKNAKWIDEDYSSSINKVGGLGSSPHSFGKTLGARHSYKTDYNTQQIIDFQYQKNITREMQLEILVPGKFDNNIGNSINVDLVSMTGSNTESEKNISGDWTIIKIADIIGTDFIQKLTLARNKFAT